MILMEDNLIPKAPEAPAKAAARTYGGFLKNNIREYGMLLSLVAIMAALADEGKCILMISSEMPELLGMCDRIYVMNEGRLVGEMAARDASQEKIMRAIVRGEGLAS